MAEKYTEAQKRATLKYMDKTVAIQIRVTSEQREHYRELANSRGISLAKFIIDALDAEVQRDKKRSPFTIPNTCS